MPARTAPATSHTNGFTRIEVLIVMAIIGVLTAILMPNLFGARRAAFERAALAYAHNVYKTGQAYIAEAVGASIPAGGCGTGTSFGGYSVGGPGVFVTGCSSSAQANKVTVTYTSGTSTVASVGQERPRGAALHWFPLCPGAVPIS